MSKMKSDKVILVQISFFVFLVDMFICKMFFFVYYPRLLYPFIHANIVNEYTYIHFKII